MGETMVRKQIYLERAQDRKVKRLAAHRGCTEAEVVREAIDRLPEAEGDDIIAILEEAGLLLPKEAPGPDDLSQEELEALEAEYEAWLATRTEPIGLSEAVLADRRERDMKVAGSGRRLSG